MCIRDSVCSGAAIGWSSDGKSMVNIPVTMMNEESQRAAQIAVDAKEEALSHKEEASAHMNKSFEYMMAAEKSESNAKAWAEFAKSQARAKDGVQGEKGDPGPCLLYTSPSPRDRTRSRMPSSA